MRALVLVSMLAALSLAQDYYEAFGQTLPFTLAAGAKAAWDNGIAVEKVRPSVPASLSLSVFPNPSNGVLRISVHGVNESARVVIYNVAGKRTVAVDFSGKTTSVVMDAPANGVYFAKLWMKGRMVKTARFLVVR